MTVVITKNSPDRYRGFLASCMCEISAGVYTSPRMTAGIRDRVWNVLSEWFSDELGHSILMTWYTPNLQGGQDIRVLGTARHELFCYDGVYLSRREADQKKLARITSEDSVEQKNDTGVA